MVISILSDIHIGKRNFRKTIPPNNINAIEFKGYEQWHNCINNIVNNKPDLLIIAGDVFHNSDPTSLCLDNAIKGFMKLEEARIKTFVIAGNHDSSFTNQIKNTHPFKNIDRFNYIAFIYNKVEYLDVDDIFITFLPHFNINNEDAQKKFDSIMRKITVKNKNINKKKILESHGVCKNWIERFINKSNNENPLTIGSMIFPDSFLNTFDYVIMGHIHQPFVQNIFDNFYQSKRIVPGSILQDNSIEDLVQNSSITGTGPLYLNTKNGELIRNNIDSIKIIKSFIKSKEELNKLMSNIDFNIYFINYDGKWEDVELNLYNKAVKNSLYFNLQVKPTRKISNISTSVQDFWIWVSKSYPEYLNEFKTIAKGEQ